MADKDQNIELKVDGEPVDVEVVTINVYKVGSGKSLLELPPETTWDEVATLLGGAGKKVTVNGKPIEEMTGPIAEATPAERTAVVGVAQGKAGL